MATAPAAQKEDLVLTSFATLSILQLIKDAQQRHGLRHGDYQRYRGYCARRVRRIRKSLGYTHLHKSVPKHPAKFYQKKINLDVVSEERYLQIAVFDAERNWSYAMQLRHEAGEDTQSRKRFHAIAKLYKAVKHTTNLETIVRQCSRVDAATKLEAQAYNAWMTGCLLFEKKEYAKALDFLRTAKTIYKKLSGVVSGSELISIYNARCHEIQPQIRFCEFTSGEGKNTDEAVSEMINMRLKIGEDESSLQDDFDKLIAEMRAKATIDHDVVITWAGRKIPVFNDAVRQLLQAMDQFNAQLSLTVSHEEKLALYEQLLGGLRDTIAKVNEENKRAAGDANATNILQTLDYLEFLRRSKTADRCTLIINHARRQSEKKPKPQDMVRLYDSVIESCREILESATDKHMDEVITEAFEMKTQYYLAFRCFYMAEACAALSKFDEAAALFERATVRANDAYKKFDGFTRNVYVMENKDDLTELLKQISLSKYGAQANRLAEAAGSLKANAEAVPQDTRALIETLDEYRSIRPEDLQKTESPLCVVPIPPNFIPMPNKPMFFDLALNHIKIPDLEAKIASFADKTPVKQQGTLKSKETATKVPQAPGKEEQQGLSGMVKGWFWGKK